MVGTCTFCGISSDVLGDCLAEVFVGLICSVKIRYFICDFFLV